MIRQTFKQRLDLQHDRDHLLAELLVFSEEVPSAYGIVVVVVLS